MTVKIPAPGNDAIRRRRHHKKSRRGCGNCKLRRVKCDETKPQCDKCIDFGVSCNYDAKCSDLQPAVNVKYENTFQVEPLSITPISQNKNLITMINSSLNQPRKGYDDGLDEYLLTGQDLETLRNFQARTVITIGTSKTVPVYQEILVKLACGHQYLMHILLTLTMMHDRYMIDPSIKQSTYEAFHWYKGTLLFNNKLSKPINPDERDAIWATAALLGVTAIGGEASKPEEAWPTKPAAATDLDWLRISDGKKEVWKLTEPLRPGGLFSALSIDHRNPFAPNWEADPKLENLPPEFVPLFGLNPTSTAENNPYHTATAILALLMDMECNHSTILHFLSFISFINPDYRRLLEHKDPRALLILAYWYAKVSEYGVWWLWRRAVIECQSICLYLDRFHGDVPYLPKLLQYPKIATGPDAKERHGSKALSPLNF